MPNAREYQRQGNERILLVGPPGSGKTSLIATLPGKKFVYMFDSAGLNSLAGQDIDYEVYLPDRVRTDPVSLAKEAQKKSPPSTLKPVAADEWDAHFNEALDSGFFSQYDVVAIDSLTSFGERIMDKLLWINGRFGQWPHEDDYGPVMTTISNTIRTMSRAQESGTFILTAHEELMQDDISKRILAQILTFGKLKYRMPTMFSEIYHCEGRAEGQHRKWIVQTVQDPRHPYIRSSIKGLDNIIDVTVKDWKNASNGQQGLAPLLKKSTV